MGSIVLDYITIVIYLIYNYYFLIKGIWLNKSEVMLNLDYFDVLIIIDCGQILGSRDVGASYGETILSCCPLSAMCMHNGICLSCCRGFCGQICLGILLGCLFTSPLGQNLLP